MTWCNLPETRDLRYYSKFKNLHCASQSLVFLEKYKRKQQQQRSSNSHRKVGRWWSLELVSGYPAARSPRSWLSAQVTTETRPSATMFWDRCDWGAQDALKHVSCRPRPCQRHKKAQPITNFQGPVVVSFKSCRIVVGFWGIEAEGFWGGGREEGDSSPRATSIWNNRDQGLRTQTWVRGALCLRGPQASLL